MKERALNWRMIPKSTNAQALGTRERDVVLKVDKLVKIYGTRRVVDGVSFEVREGEVVGLLGANGAGKTTSFRMACGLIPADEGKVMLNGLDVTSWPMYRRAREGSLGYLPQDHSTFGALTTEQNLYAAMEFLGYSRSEQKKACDEALEKFNLSHIRKSKVGYGGTGGLSGGERRRLEIARALLAHPKILLLDEPFAAVDPITVEGIQQVIRDLANEGIAILITDHQVDETLAITDRSYIINSGKVLCSGSPIEVLSNQEAVKLYFGDKAKYSRERILQKLGISERDCSLEVLENQTESSERKPESTKTRSNEPARARELVSSSSDSDASSCAANSSRLNFRRLGSNEASTSRPAENTRNEGRRGDLDEETANRRRTLTLRRHNVGEEVKRAPSPLEEERTPNKFFEGFTKKLKKR